jgi:hypothetical protein
MTTGKSKNEFARLNDPQDDARVYDFPDMENAMPRSRPSMISAWGWGVIATALSFGLILFVTLGGTL